MAKRMLNDNTTNLTIRGLQGDMVLEYYDDTKEMDLTIDAPSLLYIMNLQRGQAEMIRDWLNMRYPK